MAVMTTCCCCFTTKTGTTIIGCVWLVMTFCTSVGLCFSVINVDEYKYDLEEYYKVYTWRVSTNKTSPSLALIESVVDLKFFIEHLRVILIVLLVFYGIYTFSCLFLTYAACTDLRSLLLPWIVLEIVPFGVQIACIVIMFVFGRNDPVLGPGGSYIIAGLLQIVAFVIHVYWWMCPVAHYQTLKEETLVEAIMPVQPGQMYPTNMQKY
ncbi:uncharacterized protein LOC143027908 [Oratosquilla oratoria]|uniref:uncharacterized protein LOC143027908 n=1 Tax=Oratosquilla oratoria TaxID=337810 RepID=UPI003F772641